MPRRTASLAALLLVFWVPGTAQVGEVGTLRGFVVDSASGEAVVYANVRLDNTAIGGSTDRQGYFILPAIPPGDYRLRVSCVGYSTRSRPVTVSDGAITSVRVLLPASGIELREITVTRERTGSDTEADIGLERITARDMSILPPTIETDALRMLHVLPGVSAMSDISARYYVRGGGSDQNAMLINGATVYNPFHAMGVVSVVDPEMISAMEFHAGGFPPEFGGRLSSYLDIATRDGNSKRFSGTAYLSMLSAKLALEGPVPGGSFLVTGRKSYHSETVQKYLGGAPFPFEFYDLSLKLNYSNPALDENSRFVVHGFLSGDQVLNEDPLKEDYLIHNAIAGVIWQKVWTAPLYSTVSLSYSGLRGSVNPNFSTAKPRDNTVADITFAVNAAYVYSNKDELGFGLRGTFLSTALSMENLYGTRTALDESGLDLTIYADYRFYRWETLGLRLGMRAKLSPIAQNRPSLFEPRVSLTYRPLPSLAWKAAVGWVSQEVTTLADENEFVSIFEPWVIIPDYLAAPEGIHLSTGLSLYPWHWMSLDMEVYYKYLYDLVDINQRKYTSRDRDFVNVNGESYGLELSGRIQDRRISFYASYSYAHAFRIAGGTRFIPRYDIRHAVNLLLGLDLGWGFEADAVWVFKSGYPFTPIAGFYDRLDLQPTFPSAFLNPYEPVIFWGERHSTRLPAYHRLDIGISKKIVLGELVISGGVSLLNVYDRKNIFYFDRDNGELHHMLRFSPSVWLKAQL
jgi:hypothetical protein